MGRGRTRACHPDGARVIRLFVLLLCLLASPLAAQPFPNPDTTLVNDFAGVLDAGSEARIADSLQRLRDDHGIQMTVVTIGSRRDYGEFDTIESFATGMFNAWGVGSAARNDGIMVLVANVDREMRIELGAGYPAIWSEVAASVIQNSFQPAFRNGDMQRGIENGTVQTIRQIAVPFAQGRAPRVPARDATEPVDDDTPLPWPLIGFLAAGAALVARRPVGDALTRLRPCPKCNRRATRRDRRILDRATRTQAGTREDRRYCTHCDYEDRRIVTIPRRRNRSGGSSSFGGGRSSGGGASGRW